MKQGLRMRCRRITSGFLAFTMTAILVLGDAGAALASTDGSRFFKDGTEMSGEGYSQATSSNASFKNHREEDIVMSVFSSSDSDFRAGGMVFLDVHVKNETDTMITDGVLDFAGRKLKDSGAYFEEPGDDAISEGVLNAFEEDGGNEGLVDDSQDIELENDRTGDEEADEMAFQAYFSSQEETDEEENEKESEDKEEEEDDEPLQKIEGIQLAPGQIYTARFVYTIDEDIEKASNKSIRFRFKGKTEDRNVSQSEEFEYAVNHLNLDEIKFEDGNQVKTGETVTMGIHTTVFDFDTYLANSKVEEELKKMEEEAKKASDSNASEVVVPDTPKGTASNAEPASPSNAQEETQPGEEETEKGPSHIQDVDTEVKGSSSEAVPDQKETTEEKQTVSSSTENTGDAEESSSAATEQEANAEEPVREEAAREEAEETEATTETEETDKAEAITEAKETDKTEATTETEETDKAEAHTEAETEETEKESNSKEESVEETGHSEEETAEGDKTSDVPEVSVPEKTTTDTETKENTNTTAKDTENDETVFEDDEDNDDFVVDLGDTVYEIQMTNAKLNGFEVRDALVSDAYENMMVCSFRVSQNVKPGVYFGKVIQKTKTKYRTYRSSQGFALIVSGDGDVTLEAKVQGSDAVVTVTGPVNSFPEADQLAVSAKEITVSQDEISEEDGKMEQVQNAIEKKAQEENVDVKAFKALDIKLYADGQEVEPTGPIRVAFKNVKLEDKVTSVEAAAEGEPAEENIEDQSLISKLFSARSADGTEAKEATVTAEEAVAEATEGGENKVEVWHLPDESEEIGQVFEVQADEVTGGVAVDTDHFSIYIVVNVANEVKEIKVTVKHYATLEKWQVQNANTSGWKDMSGNSISNSDGKIKTLKEEVANNRLYPGALSGSTYATENVEIYKQDNNVVIPNGAGTGISYELAVANWSKVSLGDHYTVDSVSVERKVNGKTQKVYNNIKENNQKREIKLQDGDVVIINYLPKEGTLSGYAAFHDYNVSVNGRETNADGIVFHNVNTKQKGINKPGLVKNNANAIAVGIGSASSPNGGGKYDPAGIAHERYTSAARANKNLGNVTKGIVENSLSNNNLSFVTPEPGLFVNRDVKVDTNYYAKKYLPNYKLNFKRKGDTYIMQSIQDSKGTTVASNLDILRKTHNNPLYSNLFWPLDTGEGDTYGTKGTTRDYKYGGSTSSTKPKSPEGTAEYGFNLNDEWEVVNNGWKKAHNWFFGMRYDFEFTMGDYTGPLNYYFRGDDDFWLFIDGKKVQEVDLGGIHSSIGAYVDLKEWMKNNLPNGWETGTHKMSVFFMERGGYGSCCYMAFTLPRVSAIPSPGSETVSKTVTKNWNDGGDTTGRPGYIYVQLYQNGVAYGNAVKLEASTDPKKNWKYTWNNLPKNKEVGGSGLHEYTVREVSTPPGYEKAESGMTITNTKLENVSIEKKWVGGSSEASVRVGLFKNGTDTKVKNILTLNSGNRWKGTWSNLPMYDANKKRITYTPYEVDEEGNKVTGNTTITPSGNGYTQGTDGKYIVTYGSGNRTVTNTYNYKTITVRKKWEDYENSYKTRPAEITVQLLRNGSVYKDVILNESNQWIHTWTDLPIKANGSSPAYNYTVRELDKNGNPVGNGQSAVFQSADKDYEYTTTYSGGTGTTAAPLLITNQLKPAKLRLKKFVESNGLDNEPINKNYKFLIRVKDKSNNIHTAVSLGHNETSGYIFLIPPEAGEEFTVEEIVPMEYTLTGVTADPQNKLNGRKVTVKPGDDILITFTNRPNHEGYFHHTASVTNEKNFINSDGFYPITSTDYSEPHGNNKSDTEAPERLVIWVPERNGSGRLGEEEPLEGDEDLYA